MMSSLKLSAKDRAAKEDRVRELEVLLRRRHQTTPARVTSDAQFDSRTFGDDTHGDEFLEDAEKETQGE